MADPTLAADVKEFLSRGARDAQLGERIGARLEAVQKSHGYEAVVLLDADGHRHLLAGAVESLASRELELAREALRLKDVVLSELHWDRAAERRFVSLEIFAPLRRTSAAGSEAGGVVYLDADVSKDLYPLIRGRHGGRERRGAADPARGPRDRLPQRSSLPIPGLAVDALAPAPP